MRKLIKGSFFLVFALVLSTFQWSCEKDSSTPAFILAAKNPGIPSNLFAIVTNYNCAGCHSPAGPNPFQNLSTPQDCYQSWVGITATQTDCPGIRVIKGNAANSVLIKRLQGTCSPQMPYGGPYLSAAEVQQFIDWINQGAIPQ